MAEFAFTGPGIFDVPEEQYHADPVPGGSLSSSTAKKLVPPSVPALAKWERDHKVHKKAYDLGSVVHAMVLGKGAEVEMVDAEVWNTKAVKAQVAEIRAAGRIPMKPAEFAAAVTMSNKVKKDPIAGQLFTPGSFVAEQSIFWRDARTGCWCRAMLDGLSVAEGVRPLIIDLKTAQSVTDHHLRKAVTDYGYFQQDAWYRDAVESLGLADPAFVFVFVDVNPPHLVRVVQLDDEAITEGRARNAEALNVWADCLDTGLWPGYPEDIETISLSRYALTH